MGKKIIHMCGFESNHQSNHEGVKKAMLQHSFFDLFS